MKTARLIACLFFLCAIKRVVLDTEETTPSDVYVDGVCICVTKGACNLANGNTSTDGAGELDPRIMTVNQLLENLRTLFLTPQIQSGDDSKPITGSNNGTLSPTSSGIKPEVENQEECSDDLELCCPPGGYSCGMVYPPVADAPSPNKGQGQAVSSSDHSQLKHY